MMWAHVCNKACNKAYPSSSPAGKRSGEKKFAGMKTLQLSRDWSFFKNSDDGIMCSTSAMVLTKNSPETC